MPRSSESLAGQAGLYRAGALLVGGVEVGAARTLEAAVASGRSSGPGGASGGRLLGVRASWVGSAWPRADWPLLGLALGAGGAAMVLWPRHDPSRWARGAAGELATAALLEHLPGRQWMVLHDLALPGSRANVDHLVIGPTGVWVVDTKAYRARLDVRWRSVLVGSVPLSTAAVRWEAERVSSVLGVNARPIVAVHASGLPRRGRRCSGVRVLPATRLVRRLGRGRRLWPSLTPRQVRELGELAENQFFARAASG